MDCFTSPTIKLSAPCERPSSNKILKLSHCIRLVSWNSSIITFRILAPIFSNTNEESPSRTRLWSKALVSDNRKRLCSRFSSRTSSSMWASNCNLFRCCSDNRQLFTVLLLRGLNVSASCNKGSRLVSARWMISFFRGEVLVAQFFASSKLFFRVAFSTSLSDNRPLRNLRK